MAKRKKSEEILAEVRRDRLSKHLNEVDELIKKWVSELVAPNPFHWQESQVSWLTRPEVKDARAIRFPVLGGRSWELWACRGVYVPSLEQDAASNHILHKHLRKRALWRHHTEWEGRLGRILELAPLLCEKAARMLDERRTGWKLTDDYMPYALQLALELALESTSSHHALAEYSQRSGFSQGVWCGEILIEGSASAEQVKEVAAQHQQMVAELGQSKEMLELAKEWQQVLVLQEKMTALAERAIKSSDILYPCQFCRRLWQK